MRGAGYVVLLPDLFYRYGPYGPFVPKEVFAGDFRAILGPLMATTGNDKAAEDTGGLIAYLDTRNDIAGRNVGAVGFCMGGGMALTAAGTYPDRFAAVASFHGGNLATDAPTSPHRLASKIKAEVYIASAEKDGSYPPAMAQRLETSLTQAGVRYKAETYPALHGWMKPDFSVYDHVSAERGWAEMLALFGSNPAPWRRSAGIDLVGLRRKHADMRASFGGRPERHGLATARPREPPNHARTLPAGATAYGRRAVAVSGVVDRRQVVARADHRRTAS